MNLPPLAQRFVMHFGEMGSRWGINRTVGQMYPLLNGSAKPLHADNMGDALGFSRSSVIIAYTVFAYRVFWGKSTALQY